MKTLSRKNTMAALLLAAATVGLPAMANAQTSSYRYDECRKSDRESQLIGGAIGALAGGVAGSQIAGRGDKTEGSLIGAAIGAAAGATIADKDCGTDGYRRTTRHYPTNRTYGTTYGSNNYGSSNYGYRNSGYSGTTYRTSQPGARHHPRGRAVGNPHVHGHRNQGSSWGFNSRSHTCTSGETRRQHLEWEISELRREREYLIDKRRYVRYDRDLENRIYQIGNELEQLKRRLRDTRDYDQRDRDYRNTDYRNRDHYYYKTKR